LTDEERTMNRRDFLTWVGLGAAAIPLRAQRGNAITGVKALIFDTFGTVVDWRGSIIEEGAAWGKAKGINIDWAKFADRWRAGYAPAMDKVRKGELPWTNLDSLHRMLLEDLLKEFRIEGLSEEEKDNWNRVWHRLKPWPDSVPGLTRLKRKYTIAPCSNGNVALLNDMAKHSGLPWDLILGAEVAKHYKPDREAYLTSVSLLGLKPEEVMMCAAHSGDLNSARSLGLRTGFIHRPHEYGPTRQPDNAKPGDFDVVSENMLDLASKTGA
jgi:2-haloacid dehalogenase